MACANGYANGYAQSMLPVPVPVPNTIFNPNTVKNNTLAHLRSPPEKV